MDKVLKTYNAKREGQTSGKIWVVQGNQAYDLKHVELHSPTGMLWGYAGSGPADCALSILADYFGEKPTKKQLYNGSCMCVRLYQDFKFKFIATALYDGFVIQEEDVKAWVEEQAQKDKLRAR